MEQRLPKVIHWNLGGFNNASQRSRWGWAYLRGQATIVCRRPYDAISDDCPFWETVGKLHCRRSHASRPARCRLENVRPLNRHFDQRGVFWGGKSAPVQTTIQELPGHWPLLHPGYHQRTRSRVFQETRRKPASRRCLFPPPIAVSYSMILSQIPSLCQRYVLQPAEGLLTRTAVIGPIRNAIDGSIIYGRGGTGVGRRTRGEFKPRNYTKYAKGIDACHATFAGPGTHSLRY